MEHAPLPSDESDPLLESHTTFQQALKIATRYLGNNYYFTAKLKRKAERVEALL